MDASRPCWNPRGVIHQRRNGAGAKSGPSEQVRASPQRSYMSAYQVEVGTGAEADQSERHANKHGVSITLSTPVVMCPVRR
jgi:hypothetical protein